MTDVTFSGIVAGSVLTVHSLYDREQPRMFYHNMIQGGGDYVAVLNVPEDLRVVVRVTHPAHLDYELNVRTLDTHMEHAVHQVARSLDTITVPRREFPPGLDDEYQREDMRVTEQDFITFTIRNILPRTSLLVQNVDDVAHALFHSIVNEPELNLSLRRGVVLNIIAGHPDTQFYSHEGVDTDVYVNHQYTMTQEAGVDHPHLPDIHEAAPTLLQVPTGRRDIRL